MATTGSPMSKSPTKKFQAAATFNSTAHHHEDKRLSSPTSVTMKNSFIIKSADESFDAYYQQMKRRRHTTIDSPATLAEVRLTTFMRNRRPNARDGHTACVDKFGFMFVFGGDRH